MKLSLPLVTIGVVSERPHAHEFLWWNVLRQDYYPLEVVFVDASKDVERVVSLGTGQWGRGETVAPIAVQRILAPNSWSCGQLRNLVLERARGQYVCWMDDDDWFHPLRTKWLVEAAQSSQQPWVGWDRGWLLYLDDMTCEEAAVRGSTSVINGAAMYRTEAVAQVRYDSQPRGSDRRWIHQLAARFGTSGHILTDDRPHALWSHHPHNTSPVRWRLQKVPLSTWSARVDPLMWDDSTARLNTLSTVLRAR